MSNISFSAAAEAPDNSVRLIPLEVEHRFIQLEAPGGRLLTTKRLDWVRDHWQAADALMSENPDFYRAIQVLD